MTCGSTAVPPAATRRSASMNSSTSADPVLEQVADAPAVPGIEQVGCVAVLHVLAEHDHGQAGVGSAQFDGGPQPFVGE